MPNQVFVIASLLIYAAVLIYLAVHDSRRRQAAHFLIADRSVGWFGTMASLAGNLRDGAGLAAWVVLGLAFGYGALWFTTGLCSALLLLGILVPKIRRLAEERDFLTLDQFLSDRIGRQTARVSTLVIAITALLFAGAQVYVSGRLLGVLMGTVPAMGILLTSIIVGLYLALGGYATTIRTGIVQWCLIMVIVVLPWLLPGTSVDLSAIPSFGTPGPLMAFAAFGISFLVVFSSADIWQLLFSSKSVADGRKGFFSTIPIYYAISLGLILFAQVVQKAVGSDVGAQDAFFEVFRVPGLSPIVGSLLGLFVVASVMSTLDSQVFVFASTTVRELLGGNMNSDNPQAKRQVQLLVLIAMAVLAAIAAGIGDIVAFLFSAVTLGTILVPVIIVGVLTKNKRVPAFDRFLCWTVVVTAAIYAAMFAYKAFDNLPFTLIPAGIMAVFCIIGWFLFKGLAVDRLPQEGEISR